VACQLHHSVAQDAGGLEGDTPARRCIELLQRAELSSRLSETGFAESSLTAAGARLAIRRILSVLFGKTGGRFAANLP
jgi:hypothetical protein